MDSNDKNLQILVACHKPDVNVKQSAIYMPIHVGKALHPEVNLGFIGDDTGDNISKKNQSYCELTAVYWAWKNMKNIDIIGLAHYRRYLNINKKGIIQFFEKPGIILPKKIHCRFDNYTNLALLLSQEDFIIAIDTLLKLHPDAHTAVEKYFFQSNKYSVFNMFIADWNTFNEYANFLFPYLKDVEKRLKPSPYNRPQRSIGYIAEAMLGFWIEYRKIRVKYVSYVDYNTSVYKDGIRTKLRNFQRDLGFRLLYLPQKQKAYYYTAAVNALRGQGIDINDI